MKNQKPIQQSILYYTLEDETSKTNPIAKIEFDHEMKMTIYLDNEYIFYYLYVANTKNH